MTNNKFPEETAELTHILVVKNTETSKDWYVKVLGSEIYGEYGSSVVLKFLNNWLLLVEEGGPTEDKPNISMNYPKNPNKVDHSFTVRVKNCKKVYEELTRRGAQFITPPVSNDYEIRGFFRDPDGHLFEISEAK